MKKTKNLDSLIVSLNTALKVCTNEHVEMNKEIKFLKKTITEMRVPGTKANKGYKKFITTATLSIARKTHLSNISKAHIDNIVKTILFVKQFQSLMKRTVFLDVYSNNDYTALIKSVRHAMYFHKKHMAIVEGNIAKTENYIEDKELLIKHLRCATPTNEEAISLFRSQADTASIELSMYKHHMNYYNNQIRNLETVIDLLQCAHTHDISIESQRAAHKQR